MSSVAFDQFPPGPPREPRANTALLLAIAVHLLLFAFLFFGVNWNTQQPTPVMAELWSALPNVQPEVVQPPPPVPDPPKPVVKVQPPPEPPKPAPKVETPKPDIALAQEKARRQEAEAKAEAERKKLAEAKAEADKKKMAEQEAHRKAAEENQRRMMAELNKELKSVAPPSAAIKGPTTVGDPKVLTATYADRVSAAVRQRLNFPDTRGNPSAEVEVQQMPTGEVISVRLTKSSGLKLYDEALERAIKAASPLPKPENGAPVPHVLTLNFRLYE